MRPGIRSGIEGAVPAVLALAMALAVACGGAPDGGSGAAPTVAPAADGTDAPAFRVDDLEGLPLDLADSAGKVRILDFWATWCPPCVEEMPMFKELHETYGDRGLVIVGLSSDEDLDEVREFVAEHALPWRNAIAPEEVREAYGVVGLPQTFVIDPQGRVAKRFNAGVVPKTVLVEWVEKLLPAGTASGGA